MKTADVKRPHVCKTVCSAEEAQLGIIGVPQAGMCGVSNFSLTNVFVAMVRVIPLVGRFV